MTQEMPYLDHRAEPQPQKAAARLFPGLAGALTQQPCMTEGVGDSTHTSGVISLHVHILTLRILYMTTVDANWTLTPLKS